MSIKQAFTQFRERRQADRRKPLLTLTIAEAELLLLETQFTGAVTVMYASGVKKEMQISDPMRIVLDKPPQASDSRDGE